MDQSKGTPMTPHGRPAVTIGQKVWFYAGRLSGHVLDHRQPFDATVVFVLPDGSVNLSVRAHDGRLSDERRVGLREPAAGDNHVAGRFATWQGAGGASPAGRP